ncbi:MAG TPA: thioesterase family protein [Acidimicrobiales bacterium]|nr:thioesterase family protein [Acidimicrobiales bacterium]
MAFADDIARTPRPDDAAGGGPSFAVTLAERWNVGRNQNGGVLLATVAGALAEVAGHPHPLATTAHYLGAATDGPASVRTQVIKPGRTYASAVGELWQDDRERARVVGAFGDLTERAVAGPSMFAAPPPDGPAPDACDDLFDLLVAGVGERALTRSLRNFEIRVDPDGGWGGAGGDEPSLRGWIRMRDEATVTPLALLAVADGFPPSLLGRAEMGWLPTIELTVHLFGVPPVDEPWLRAVLRTRTVVGGLLDEDGELWDASGALVARFRQLAMLIPRDAR